MTWFKTYFNHQKWNELFWKSLFCLLYSPNFFGSQTKFVFDTRGALCKPLDVEPRANKFDSLICLSAVVIFHYSLSLYHLARNIFKFGNDPQFIYTMYSLSSYMQRAMARCIWVTWKTHAVITHTRSSFSFLYCGLLTHLLYCIEYEINRRATKVGTFEVCVLKHDALHMFIMQVLASQLHFLANRNAELAVPSLFWPVNCIKIRALVALTAELPYYLFSILYLCVLIQYAYNYRHMIVYFYHI